MVVLCVFGSLKNEFGGIFIDILLYELIIYMEGEEWIHMFTSDKQNVVIKLCTSFIQSSSTFATM